MPSITCGFCHETHSSVGAVRDCGSFREPDPAPYYDDAAYLSDRLADHRASEVRLMGDFQSFGEAQDDGPQQLPDHLQVAEQLAKMHPRDKAAVPVEERVYLACPYDDKEKVKNYGGRWDRDAKEWWVTQEAWEKYRDDLRQWEKRPVTISHKENPPARKPSAPTWDFRWAEGDIPEGYYAILQEDAWKFYRVTWGKEGSRWQGTCFLEVQAGDDLHRVSKKEVKNQILSRIAVDPREAALQYGHQIGRCAVCHRTLTNEESISAGIGPRCASKRGW